MRALFFGVDRVPGHYLIDDHKRSVCGTALEYARPGVHIDGSLAPRAAAGVVACLASIDDEQKRRRFQYRSEECPQGQFLRRVLPNGFTTIAWWDRCQGDKRGACNSVFLLEGEHSSEAMVLKLAEHFPRVVQNLTHHGVSLVEVFEKGVP